MNSIQIQAQVTHMLRKSLSITFYQEVEKLICLLVFLLGVLCDWQLVLQLDGACFGDEGIGSHASWSFMSHAVPSSTQATFQVEDPLRGDMTWLDWSVNSNSCNSRAMKLRWQ